MIKSVLGCILFSITALVSGCADSAEPVAPQEQEAVEASLSQSVEASMTPCEMACFRAYLACIRSCPRDPDGNDGCGCAEQRDQCELNCAAP